MKLRSLHYYLISRALMNIRLTHLGTMPRRFYVRRLCNVPVRESPETRLSSWLPETAPLCAAARDVGADIRQIRLGARVTKCAVNRLATDKAMSCAEGFPFGSL